jgi:hypothetical protein
MALAKHQASMSRKNINFTPSDADSDSVIERSASLTGVDLFGEPEVKELRSDNEVGRCRLTL